MRLIIREVVALAAAGCKYIQIDEPLLVRSPQVALEYGIDHLWECFCVRSMLVHGHENL